MEITEKQFFDYMHCPALFEMKYVKGIAISEHQTMSDLLNRVANYFFLHLLNEHICTTGELKKKWDSICEANPHIIDEKKAMDGISLILKFANWAEQNKIVVLDVDSRYNIVVNRTEIVGNTGAILALPGDKQEMIVTNFSNKMPDQSTIDMRMKYTLQAYGFEQTHGRPLSGIRVLSVKHFKDFYTTRNKEDFRRLRTAIDNIGKSIEQRLFYPRESVTCPQCPAKQYCRYWYC